MMNSPEIRKIINAYIDTQRRNKCNYRIERENELKKQAPQRANVILGRAEIPIWTWENFEIWDTKSYISRVLD